MSVTRELLEPNEPVYSAAFEKYAEEGDLVTFGGVAEGITYGDGAMAESHISFNKYLWTIMGCPDKIVVMMSKSEFTAISTEAYDRLRGLLD